MLLKIWLNLIVRKTKIKWKSTFWKFWLVLIVNGSLCIFEERQRLQKCLAQKFEHLYAKLCSLSISRCRPQGVVIVPDYWKKKYNLTKDYWKICEMIPSPCINDYVMNFLGLDYYNIKGNAGLVVSLFLKMLHGESYNRRLCDW